MRRVIMFGLLMLMGCQNTIGPLMNRQRPGKIDDPLYNIEEQKARARDRTAVPLDDRSVTPNTYSGTYGPTGR